MTIPASAMSADPSPLDTQLDLLEGAVPDGLRGHVFVVGAVPGEGGAALFNGDGLVVRFDFTGDGPRLKRRVLQHPSLLADRATAEDRLLKFRNADLARYSVVLGVRNQLNTAFLTMPETGRLFATYDAGRPWEINPDSLDLITPIGRMDEWETAFSLLDRPGLRVEVPWLFPPILSGAHPAHDEETGETFLANWSLGELGRRGRTSLLRWDGKGDLGRWRLVRPDGSDISVQSLHQIAVTRNWVVLVDTAFNLEFGRLLLPRMWPMSPQRPDTRVYLVDRRKLRSDTGRVVVGSLQLPREVVHFAADYDELEDGLIVFHAGHPCASDASESILGRDRRWDCGRRVRGGLRGFLCGATDQGYFGRYVLDPVTEGLVGAATTSDPRLWGPAIQMAAGAPRSHRKFWWSSMGYEPEAVVARVVKAYRDYPYRTVAPGDFPSATIPPSLVRVDAHSVRLEDRYDFPAGALPAAPQLVPSAADKEDPLGGFLVVTVVKDGVGGPADELWVFASGNLAGGPVCRLSHRGLNLPLVVHSAWMPRVPSAGGRPDYRVPPQEDFDLSRMPAVWPWSRARRLVEDHVLPHLPAPQKN